MQLAYFLCYWLLPAAASLLLDAAVSYRHMSLFCSVHFCALGGPHELLFCAITHWDEKRPQNSVHPSKQDGTVLACTCILYRPGAGATPTTILFSHAEWQSRRNSFWQNLRSPNWPPRNVLNGRRRQLHACLVCLPCTDGCRHHLEIRLPDLQKNHILAWPSCRVYSLSSTAAGLLDKT